jgi:hypothetical protein
MIIMQANIPHDAQAAEPPFRMLLKRSSLNVAALPGYSPRSWMDKPDRHMAAPASA